MRPSSAIEYTKMFVTIMTRESINLGREPLSESEMVSVLIKMCDMMFLKGEKLGGALTSMNLKGYHRPLFRKGPLGCPAADLLSSSAFCQPTSRSQLMGRLVASLVHGAGRSHPHFASTLRPPVKQQSSKTQGGDWATRADRVCDHYIGPLQIHRLALHADKERLSSITLGQYSLRATVIAAGIRNLAEAHRCNQERSAACVLRYRNGGRVTKQMNRLGPLARALAINCASAIADVESYARLPPGPL
jgi:hypothetical protein